MSDLLCIHGVVVSIYLYVHKQHPRRQNRHSRGSYDSVNYYD